jgi:small subunit ribosomal protein S17
MTDTATKFKKQLRGVVVSDAMDKTRVVKVERYVKHPKYGKFYKVSKRYQAHDENNQYPVGTKVIIESARPMSRKKSFVIISAETA